MNGAAACNNRSTTLQIDKCSGNEPKRHVCPVDAEEEAAHGIHQLNQPFGIPHHRERQLRWVSTCNRIFDRAALPTYKSAYVNALSVLKLSDRYI
jgi:hypothetical protein